MVIVGGEELSTGSFPKLYWEKSAAKAEAHELLPERRLESQVNVFWRMDAVW